MIMLKAVGFHKELESMTQLVSSSPVQFFKNSYLVSHHYQLKDMMTSNTKYNLREDHTMLNENNVVCFHLLMFMTSHCPNTIAQDGYRSSLFKTVQLEKRRGSQINGELCKQFQQKLFFNLLLCFATEILFSSL